jgi:hypothetical protein
MDDTITTTTSAASAAAAKEKEAASGPLSCASAPLNYAIAYVGSAAACVGGTYVGATEQPSFICSVMAMGVLATLGLGLKICCRTPLAARAAWSTAVSFIIVASGVAVLITAGTGTEPIIPVALVRCVALAAEIIALLWSPVLWETAWDIEVAAHHGLTMFILAGEIYANDAELALMFCTGICATELVRLLLNARAALLACCEPHHCTVALFWLAVFATHVLVRFPVGALLHRYSCYTATWAPEDAMVEPKCHLGFILHYQNWLITWAFVALAKQDWQILAGAATSGIGVADVHHGYLPRVSKIRRHRVFGFEYAVEVISTAKVGKAE